MTTPANNTPTPLPTPATLMTTTTHTTTTRTIPGQPSQALRATHLIGPPVVLAIAALLATLLLIDVGPAYALAPALSSQSVLNVTDTSATLEAAVESETPGALYFEYGTTESYGSRAPAGVLATPTGASTQSEPVNSLQSNTIYHYRAILITAGETVTGEDQTFTTQADASTFTLPDNRAWELVSPPEKHGARIEAISKEGGLIQAAQDGTAITYTANSAVGEDPEGNPSLADTQVISTRNTTSGWKSRDVATAHTTEPEGLEVGELEEYFAFNQNLTKGLVEPQGLAPQLTSNSPETSIYIRENLYAPIGATYTALINTENTPPGTHYGNNPAENIHPTEYVAASGNLEHIIVSSGNGNLPLTSEYPNGGFYEWTNGVLTPITILNGEFLQGNVEIGDHDYDIRNAVSEDGNRVFWTLEKGETEANLYVREVASGRSVQVDTPQGVTPSGKPDAIFMDALPNGERVYFKDGQRLTPNATAEEDSPDLYEYNTSTGVLTDLTPDTQEGPLAGTGSDVAGELIGSSENGEYVYYVASAALAPGALTNAPNLYVEHITAGGHTTTLVAQLTGADEHDWEKGAGNQAQRKLSGLTARVSPDGQYLAFMSSGELTGYDNADAVSPEQRDQEVFEYDAATDKLSCASCDPTGARPHGVLDKFEAGEGLGLLVDRPELWTGSWLAGSVPGWTSATPEFEGADYQSRYLNDHGQLFFMSPDALVSQDTNGKEDVYEYEPEGVGACGVGVDSGSEVYKPEHKFKIGREAEIEGEAHKETMESDEPAGCVGLISSGSSSHESAFLDASESGEDVFFLTAATLASEDHDASYDVYDAHACPVQGSCSAASSMGTASACSDSASCEPNPAGAAGIGVPLSSLFQGSGNETAPATTTAVAKPLTRGQKLAAALRTCTKKTKSKRKACVALARKRYGPVKAKSTRHHTS